VRSARFPEIARPAWAVYGVCSIHATMIEAENPARDVFAGHSGKHRRTRSGEGTQGAYGPRKRMAGGAHVAASPPRQFSKICDPLREACSV
jgi:hypothetical protein